MIFFFNCAESFLHFSENQMDYFVGFHVRTNHPPNISMRTALVDLLRLSLGLVWSPYFHPEEAATQSFPIASCSCELNTAPSLLGL